MSDNGPTESPYNPWGSDRDGDSSPATAALAAVAALAASQDLDLDRKHDAGVSTIVGADETQNEDQVDGRDIVQEVTTASVEAQSPAVSCVRLVADSATNTSPRSSAASENHRVEYKESTEIVPTPSAPEPPNKESALLLEQHVLLEEAFNTAEALRARLEAATAAHEEKERESALRIKQLETSREQEQHKTEAALKRVFTAEATMMKLRKECEDKAVLVEETKGELAKVRELLRAENEAKAERQRKTDELEEYFRRQKQVVAALQADNEALKAHSHSLNNTMRAEKDRNTAEIYALQERIEQFRRQLLSVEEEDEAKTTRWGEALESQTLALEEERSRSLAATKRLQEETTLREKLERRFVQLQGAFDEATDQLCAARAQVTDMKKASEVSAASAAAREVGKEREEGSGIPIHSLEYLVKAWKLATQLVRIL